VWPRPVVCITRLDAAHSEGKVMLSSPECTLPWAVTLLKLILSETPSGLLESKMEMILAAVTRWPQETLAMDVMQMLLSPEVWE
jgi:hypothetical protein